MDPDVVAFLLLAWTAVALLAGIVVLVARRRTIGNFAALTAFHDFQTKEKQAGIEIFIEKKSGKQDKNQESGDADPTARPGRNTNELQ